MKVHLRCSHGPSGKLKWHFKVHFLTVMRPVRECKRLLYTLQLPSPMMTLLSLMHQGTDIGVLVICFFAELHWRDRNRKRKKLEFWFVQVRLLKPHIKWIYFYTEWTLKIMFPITYIERKLWKNYFLMVRMNKRKGTTVSLVFPVSSCVKT